MFNLTSLWLLDPQIKLPLFFMPSGHFTKDELCAKSWWSTCCFSFRYEGQELMAVLSCIWAFYDLGGPAPRLQHYLLTLPPVSLHPLPSLINNYLNLHLEPGKVSLPKILALCATMPNWGHLPLKLRNHGYQFSSVQSLSCVRLFVNHMNHMNLARTIACQASLSITNSQSLPKPMSIESVMLFNHLILCRPLLLVPPVFPSIRVFSNESTLRMRWPKYWSFSFNISPSNEHPGLISFRMDWLKLLAVQGTLKSLHQHHSSKASVLQCSAFFIVQLSHPYMTTGKTIVLARRTFVGKVMFLLFNMLSRLVITFLARTKHLLISWLQSPSVVILEPPKIKCDTVSTVSPSFSRGYSFRLMEQDVYWKQDWGFRFLHWLSKILKLNHTFFEPLLQDSSLSTPCKNTQFQRLIDCGPLCLAKQ